MEIANLNLKGELRRNEQMSRHTSFGIGGPADVLAWPADRDDLLALLQTVRKKKLPYFILGGGTNLLVRDNGFRGVVISLRRMNRIALEREYASVGGSFGVVFAEAGASLPKLVSFAAEQGFTGLEFAAGIPGTVGGAVCMNAGTALGEIGGIIDTVTLVSPEGGLISRGQDEMGFGYRTSSVPEGHLVLEASVVLRRGDSAEIKARVQELLDTRKERQPWGLPNAGSMFKNPREGAAGRLIEEAGLKGRRVGNAQVSEKHANFIVNLGKASAADVLQLMEIVQQAVFEKHRVRLEPEIKIIGEE